ncbi:MAG: hypothetical protein NXH75_09745 [Halobacteriovoraceae bacterium]|nr:hypothetical protein [Halobacteriovoraceae bacterium]
MKEINLSNHAGSITILNSESDVNTYSFEKREWKEWCLLHHKEEGEKIGIKVENTSFTGNGGCLVDWTITLNKDSSLTLEQAAGMIKGTGTVSNLTINLAAGDLKWEDGNMPFTLQVAAGKVTLKNMNFPTLGESSISVGTGSVSVSSPEKAPVSTEIQKAIGSESNDFSENKNGHKLSIQVAVGKANHSKL